MHDRNYIWITEKGERVKLKNIKTRHLENILKMLKKNKAKDKTISLFNQELRLRKLNSINNNPEYNNLF